MSENPTGPVPNAATPPQRRFDRLGPYQILKELGKGGMGVVFLAYQENLDRQVALKVILPHLAGNAGLMARFKRECQTHSQLDHPNIVRFFDSGEDQGFHFYAMEYLDAVPLDVLIKETDTTSDFRLAHRVAEGMASALAHLHGKGIVHRDIKPGNVMIERRTGRVVMMDFGLVKPSDVTRLTREGKTVGSPRYMAPEMLEGLPTDGRTDIYQVGVSLYQLVSGKVPFDGKDLSTLAAAILYGELEPPRTHNPAIPEALENFILNCMDRDRENRYESGEEMLQDVKRLRSGLAVRLLVQAEPPSGETPSRSSGDYSVPSFSASMSHSASLSTSRPTLGASGPSGFATASYSQTRTPSRIPPLLPILLFLLAVSVVPFFLGSSTSYQAVDVETIPGIHAVQLRWRGEPSYPSRVSVRPEGTEAPDLARIFLGDAPAEGAPHELEIEPLDPQQSYEARILFPDGTASLPRLLPKAHGEHPRVEHSFSHREERVDLEVHCSPPCRGSLRYRGADGWEELPLENRYLDLHRLELAAPPPDGAWHDASLQLLFVGRRQTYALGKIPGRDQRLEDFCEKVRALDMDQVIRSLEEDGVGKKGDNPRLVVEQTLELPELEEVLEEIRARGGLGRGTRLDWSLYQALHRLEGVDFWLASKDHPPVLDMASRYRELVRVSYPERIPTGGQTLFSLDIEGGTAFMPLGGSTSGNDTFLKAFAASTSIKQQEVLEGKFRIGDPPAEGARAALAIQVRNLHPAYSFQVTLGENPPLHLHTTFESFKGYYWAQIRDMSRQEARKAISRNMQWIYAEFPATLLRQGRNEFRVTAHIQEGMDSNHFVDAYQLRLWPEAPVPSP